MVLTGIKWGNLREEDHLKDSGVDGSLILKRIFKKWDGGHRQNRSGSRQALVNVVMNLWVSENAGNFLSSLGCVSFLGWTVLHGVS